MPSTRALGGALTSVVLLLAGCSAPAAAPATTTTNTTTAAPAAGTTSSSTTTTSSQAAPAAGAVDKTALLKQIADASASIKTSTTTMNMSMTVNGAPMTTKIVMGVDQTDKSHVKANGELSLAGVPMKMVIDGDIYYVQMGGTWIKMDKASMEKSGQKAPDTANMGTVIGQLENQVQSADLVGDENVEGVATKHYKLVLDGAAFSDLSGQKEPTGLKTIPYDIWVDGSNQVRKFSMTFKQDGSDVTMAGTVSKINEPITIEIPKDAKTLPGS